MHLDTFPFDAPVTSWSGNLRPGRNEENYPPRVLFGSNHQLVHFLRGGSYEQMTRIDYTGARGSNAGDRFHEVWALRHVLALLQHHTSLKVVTVEGILGGGEVGQPELTWQGVDCALYYSGATASPIESVVIEQLKYSSADPQKPWTISEFTRKTAQRGNNSIIRRLAQVYEGTIQKYPRLRSKVRVRFISNRPIAGFVAEDFDYFTISANNTRRRRYKCRA